MEPIFLPQPGINICWGEYLDANRIEKTINQIVKDGYKVLRLWLCRWGIRGLWHQDYILEKPNSAIDLNNLILILKVCHKFEIKVILTIIPHAHFLTTYHYEVEKSEDAWPGNPFKKNLRTPYQFFKEPTIRFYFENFLYFLYKTFPSNALPWSIELWNEVDMVANLPKWLVVDWHRQMLNFCKKLNPQILLTTSTAVPDSLSELFSLDSLDAISLHNYRFPYSSAIANLYYWHKSLSTFNKPLWLTEFGFSSQRAVKNTDSIAYLQSAVITSPCLGYQLGPCFWWWESILSLEIVPKLALSKVFEWLTKHPKNCFVDLINVNYINQQKTEKIGVPNFLGKTPRYLARKSFHKAISFVKKMNNALALQSDNNFLVIIEASKSNSVRLSFRQKGIFFGTCYNLIDEQNFLASCFHKDHQTYWLAECVQILIIQKK